MTLPDRRRPNAHAHQHRSVLLVHTGLTGIGQANPPRHFIGPTMTALDMLARHLLCRKAARQSEDRKLE